MRLKGTLSAVAAICLCTAVSANPQDITAGELALTPAFCQDVQTINGWSKTKPSPRTPHWLAVMGENFWAMHHYCWGMVGIHRSRAAGLSAQVRTFLRNEAIRDYQFVLRNTTPDFVLLPEIHYRIGEAHTLLRQYAPAIEAFTKARAIKPDFWPAYVGESEVLETLGKKAQARKLIEEALQRIPDQPQLQKRLAHLGGKPAEVAAPGSSPAGASTGR